MNFLTSHYWKEGEAATSLTLHQVTRRKGKVPVVLACVCEECEVTEEQGSGERFCIQLTDWFYERVLERCVHGKKTDLRVLGEEVVQMARDTCFSTAGLMCIEERFLLFYRGEQRICLLNKRFMRSNLKELSANTEAGGSFMMEEGLLEDKVGVLLGTESFYRGISGEDIRSCLAADAIYNEKQADRRLLELGRFGGNGESKGAAVLVMTC